MEVCVVSRLDVTRVSIKTFILLAWEQTDIIAVVLFVIFKMSKQHISFGL